MSAIIFAFSCLAVATNGRVLVEDHSSQLGEADPRAVLGELLFAMSSPSRSLGHRTMPRIPRTSKVSMGLKVGDEFPAEALKQFGVKGKKSVLFFYGADDAPSCSKQISAFSAAIDDFKQDGFTVVGVRNAAGVKGDTDAAVELVVDEEDAVRTEIGIAKDLFGLLGGRETYVIDKSGIVAGVHNNQFDPASHVKVALAAIESMPKEEPKTNPFEQFLSSLR
jgi:peroxiredoxin Q/BCP